MNIVPQSPDPSPAAGLKRRTVLKTALAGLLPLGHATRAVADVAGPTTILIQPEPIVTRVVHYHTPVRTITTIMRQWEPGDTGRCRLCAKCSAHDDGCMVAVGKFVERESAPLFSIVGLKMQTTGTGPRAGEEGGGR